MAAVAVVAGLRALIYCRVSKDKRQGRSVAEQEDSCRADCERNGWTVEAVLTDNSLSGSRFARKVRDSWVEVKRMLATGEIDVLVTWASTRSQRDLDEYAALRRLCEAHGVMLAYDGRLYDLSDPDDRYFTGVDALNGERHAAIIHRDVMRAMKANVEQGKPHGQPLYGYERTYDNRSGSPTGQRIVDDQAAVDREAARRFLLGESAASIAADFNARGIPSPGGSHWITSTIRKMLTNTGYTGRRTHYGEVVEAGPQWEPILDDQTFAKLSVRFTDPKRRTNRDRTDLTHVLTGIMRCGVPGCPGTLRRQVTRGAGTYVCRVSKHLSRDQRKVEAYVIAEVLSRLEAPDLVQRVLAEAENPAATAALEEARVLRARLDANIAANVAGKLDPELLQAAADELKPMIAAADRAAREAGETVDTSVLLGVAGQGARDRWKRLEIAGQRNVIRALVDITVLPARRRGEPFDPALIQLKFRFN